MTVSLAKETLLKELAVRAPATIEVFERYRLDYCCHGDQSLEAACAQRNVSVEAVLADLRAALESAASDVEGTAASSPDWTATPLRELCAHILKVHHAYLRVELPRLEPYLKKIGRVHGQNHPELREATRTFAELSEAVRDHLREEEEVLFPQIVRIEAAEAIGESELLAELKENLRRREAEHRQVGQLLDKLAELLDDYQTPEDACPTYRHVLESLARLAKDLRQHIHLENNLLHPRAAALAERLASPLEVAPS